MVLVLAPPRRPETERGRIASRTAALVLGLVAGGALVGLAFGSLGLVLATVVEYPPLAFAAAIIAITYALADLGLVRLPRAGRHWQVPRRWLTQMPSTEAFLFFGMLLGMGFLTAVPYASFTSLLALEAGTASPLAGAACGAAYGAGRGLAVLIGRWQASQVDSFTALIPRIVDRVVGWRMALAATTILAGVWSLVVLSQA